MNKSITIFFLLLAMSFPAQAEMKNQSNTSGSQTQMMSHKMMRNMTGVMQQMQTMTRDMNRIMEHTATMDQTRTREMARIMQQLSEAMLKMSQHMAKGEMNNNTQQEMQRQMKQISNMVKKMEQKTK
jgi:hypothetical protein